MTRIVSTGSYLPEKIITNDFFGKPKNPEQLASIEKYMTGMRERRHANPKETGVYMGLEAAKKAIEKSNYSIDDIDMIIGNVTPNQFLIPEDLNLIADSLGCSSTTVLPINTACSSFISALNLARILISSNEKKVILTINSANITNNILDKSRDYSMFGDGAGAVLLDNTEDNFISLEEDSDQRVFHTMCMKSPVFSDDKEHFKVIEDKKIDMIDDQVKKPIDTARKLLAKLHLTPDHFLAHQAGVGMLEYWTNLIELNQSCLRHTFDKCANMMSANIPVTLDYWVSQGNIKRGDHILFFSPAAGAHYISMMWKY